MERLIQEDLNKISDATQKNTTTNALPWYNIIRVIWIGELN